jgi:Leucine-rich repeat (LRR) protein
MSARSLTEVVKLKGKVTNLVLSSSKDLVCKNLWCEKVTGPCICRLERALQKIDLSGLTSLDLSGNRLSELPPSVKDMVALREIDLSNNDFAAVPSILSNIKTLEVINMEENPANSV